jgi:hypothetical protein
VRARLECWGDVTAQQALDFENAVLSLRARS